MISPRGGLRPNTTYSVRLLPGLLDLENNADSVGRTWVFSTGPSIADGVMSGRIFDWAAARHARSAHVEAVALPDSARSTGTTESTGAFVLRHLPTGTLSAASADRPEQEP